MFLEFLLRDLEEKSSANFFLPSCNLLNTVPRDVIKELVYVIKSTLRHLQSSLMGSKYVPIQIYTKLQGSMKNSISCDGFTDWMQGYGETVRNLLKRSLFQTFDETTNLLVMTSFAQHHVTSIDASITLHENVIRNLKGMKGQLVKRHKLLAADLGDFVNRFVMFVQV